MPTLSNGSELTVWDEPDNPNPSPSDILFTITEPDGDVFGPFTAKSDFFFGGVDLVRVDVFDGFFTISSFTNEGRTQTWTTVETQVFDNEGNFIRTLTDQAAYVSAQIVAVEATSPDDITVTWIGANEYSGGENTQYGQHQMILVDGVLQADTFVNHDPTVADIDLTLSQGEIPGEAPAWLPFKATDADYDMLTFVIVDGPDHGTVEQETRFDGNYYPFHQGNYAGSLHYHYDFLGGNLFEYLPDAGFVGTDSFTVYASDGQGNSNVATITITVTPPAQSVSLSNARDDVSYAGYGQAMVVAALAGDDRVNGTAYNDTLDGGDGHDQLLGNGGADRLFGGNGTDWLKGGDGYDTLDGGAGTDGLRGDAGDDALNGGAGSDDVQGGAGEDTLNGGIGRDRLAGGTGRDIFVFDAVGLANDDVITDFNVLDDVILLAGSVFAELQNSGPLQGALFVNGDRALDDSDRIIYNQATGELLFDVDGVGGAAAARFAVLENRAALTADDFIVA